MAVLYDNSAIKTGTSTLVAVCTLTIAANACLIVGVSTQTNVSISACVAGSTTMTQLGRVLHNANGANVTLYGLTAAPSGSVSISANVVGGGAATMCIVAASYTGQRQTNPFGVIKIGSASNVANFALSYSTSTTDRLIFFCGSTNNTSATNTTLRQTDTQHLVTLYSDTAGPASTFSLSCTAVNSTFFAAFIGLNIAATSAVSSGIKSFLAMQGVGV